jgi:murein DD-endopeptidase MepM/ murein hydrolase activator NlpD
VSFVQLLIAAAKSRAALLLVPLLLALPMPARADLASPVEHGVVTSGVGWRIDPFGSGKRVFHRGIDIAVPVGTPVHATRKGRVVLAGDDHHGHGFTVILQHENGDRTLFGHNSLLRVHEGDVVEPGTVIAFSGSSGRSTGPHVHFEQIPSGRPYIEETAETAEATLPKLINDTEEKRMLEQIMDETVGSVLRKLKKPGVAGLGG